jgi:hypothetical protein
MNWNELQDDFLQLMDDYYLSDEDVDVYDYEDMEEYSDD